MRERKWEKRDEGGTGWFMVGNGWLVMITGNWSIFRILGLSYNRLGCPVPLDWTGFFVGLS